MKSRKRITGDVLGNIVVLKFDKNSRISNKKDYAKKFLKEHKNITTVLEKSGKFSGRLRTQKTSWLAGEKTKEALYRENACVFRFNIDSCYFSPRLSSERKDLAGMVKKNENVLVLFGGVAPFAIVIAKLSGCKKVVSVELGRECSKYAKINVKRNKLKDKIQILQGDVRKKCNPKVLGKFDRIVMARPNLKDSFLDVAFPLVKPKGTVHYYGFYEEHRISVLKDLVKEGAKKARKKIRILKVKKAGGGGIAPYKFRYRIDFKVI